MQTEPRQFFAVHRWMNPQTTSDYPFLAVAEDRSALLSLGNYGLSLDFGLPEEAAGWLACDFAPTHGQLGVELTAIRRLLRETFVNGVEFAVVTYDAQLIPSGLELSLGGEPDAIGADYPREYVREYVIEGYGSYQRLHRDTEQLGPVTLGERFMLDVCVSSFAELAAQCAPLLTEPPPPRYRTWALPAQTYKH